MKVAINGFGRIGRAILRICLDKKIDVVAINDVHGVEDARYLLKYDSVYGVYNKKVKAGSDFIEIGDKKIKVFAHKFPENIPWKEAGVDVVVESTGFFTDKLDVLHIAPEQPFYKHFEKLENLNYTTADLESPIAKVKMDIREMPFTDNSFDVLLCNHVLEHIDDELKATKEIYRVLKPNGWAILQIPMDLSLEKTYEDLTITDPKEREKHFGQYDHVRQYGRDYAERLRRSGLVVIEDNFVESFSSEQILRYRFDEKEMIYLCKKE